MKEKVKKIFSFQPKSLFVLSILVFITYYVEILLELTQNQFDFEKSSAIVPELLFGTWNDGPFT